MRTISCASFSFGRKVSASPTVFFAPADVSLFRSALYLQRTSAPSAEQHHKRFGGASHIINQTLDSQKQRKIHRRGRGSVRTCSTIVTLRIVERSRSRDSTLCVHTMQSQLRLGEAAVCAHSSRATWYDVLEESVAERTTNSPMQTHRYHDMA